MNHESEHQPDQDRSPERASVRHGTLGDEFMAELYGAAPTRRAAHNIAEQYAQHGTPFALYLGLDDVDPYGEELAQRFKADFVGTYPDRQSLMDETLETLGLREDLDEFMRTHMEFEGLLTFDYDTLWELLQDRYEIIDIGGVLYVFER